MLLWPALSMTKVRAVFKSLAHVVCLERLSVVIKYAAHKKSWDISFYRRVILITEIRVSKYVTHLRDREISNVAEQSGLASF